jgi:hypothetical protein
MLQNAFECCGLSAKMLQNVFECFGLSAKMLQNVFECFGLSAIHFNIPQQSGLGKSKPDCCKMLSCVRGKILFKF